MSDRQRIRPSTMKGGLICPSCHLILPAIHKVFVAHFRGQNLECPGCRKTLTPLWDLALRLVREDWTCMNLFQLAGAKHTYGRARLKADRGIAIDLSKWGVPKGAEILKLQSVAVGPSEGPVMMPLRMEQVARQAPHVQWVYGATYGRRPLGPTQVMISVSWVAAGPDEVSVHHLAEAARQYEAGRYDGVPIPANIAVEAALGQALRDWVMAFCTKIELGDFLSRGATYAHQLKVLSSIAADTLRAARLDLGIRNRLDNLRSYRNDVGHQGRTGVASKRPTLGKEKAGEFLTAAIFGYHYAKYLHAAIKRMRRRKTA